MLFYMTFIVFFIWKTLAVDFEHDFCKRKTSNIVADDKSLCDFLYGDYEQQASDMCNRYMKAEFNHLVDMDNPLKAERALNMSVDSARFERTIWKAYFKDIDVKKIYDPNLSRQVRRLQVLGFSALSDDKLAELSNTLSQMLQIYTNIKICPYTNPKCKIKTEGMHLDPGIEDVMAESADYDELLYTWIAWQDSSGSKMRVPFETYVDLANEAARANNFTDRGSMWRHEYESKTLEEDIDKLWMEIEPLYHELHKYVLHKIKFFYQKELGDDDDNLIPAHLLGNMWAQSWINIKKLVIPFPHAKDIDIGDVLQEKNVSALQMFQLANSFYTSMGLESMDMAYEVKEGNVIEKPPNKTMLCHASAWDFCNGNDFRIKMCTQQTESDFITIHHELGHIQYYLQYRYLPISYRRGANPAFHEAIGDTIGIAVRNPSHYQAIGLIAEYSTYAEKAEINTLMSMALERIVFLPYAIVIDKWRWDIFSEKIEPEKWNSHYWYYREKYQKIKPPVPRSNDDLDAAGKIHVITDAPYISYYFARILQFQIFKSLCIEAGEYPDRPLHRCDFYGSKEAGKKLARGLKLGASRHWSFILNLMTGDKKIKTDALLEYFEPLYKFLKKQNACHIA